MWRVSHMEIETFELSFCLLWFVIFGIRLFWNCLYSTPQFYTTVNNCETGTSPQRLHPLFLLKKRILFLK